MENISVAPVEVALEPQATTEATNKIEEDMPLNNIGHNQQEISELLENSDICIISFNKDNPYNNVHSFAGHSYQFTHTITTSSLFISTLQCVVLVL